jgi:hypothetical protein
MSNIQIIGWSTTEFQDMALAKVHARLGHERKDMFKRFSCASMFAESIAEARELDKMGDKHYRITGFVALDDGGKGRAFDFLIEKGLPWKDARELADQLALQVDQCADRMIADRKKGLS